MLRCSIGDSDLECKLYLIDQYKNYTAWIQAPNLPVKLSPDVLFQGGDGKAPGYYGAGLSRSYFSIHRTTVTEIRV